MLYLLLYGVHKPELPVPWAGVLAGIVLAFPLARWRMARLTHHLQGCVVKYPPLSRKSQVFRLAVAVLVLTIIVASTYLDMGRGAVSFAFAAVWVSWLLAMVWEYMRISRLEHDLGAEIVDDSEDRPRAVITLRKGC